MQPLSGKVALVTGGSKGIGRAISLRLARDGAKVVVNYSNDSSAAKEVISLIGEEDATAIKADAGNVEEISRLVDTAVEKYGKIDILVACTATMKLNELENVTGTEFDQTFNLNVKGPLFLAQVRREFNSELNGFLISLEIRSSYGTRFSHHSLLYNPMPRQHSNTKLPNLHHVKRSNRANDTRSFERPCT